jgi:hypothetical protein
MIKALMFSTVLLLIPLMSSANMGSAMRGYDSGYDNNNDSEEIEMDPVASEELEKVKDAFERAQNEPQVYKINSGGNDWGCLQSPTNKLYKERMSTIIKSRDFLNKEFEGSDSGAKWYVVSC